MNPQPANPNQKPRKVGAVRMILGAIVLLFTLGCWGAFMQGELGAYEIESGSMEPTMELYDRVLAKPVPRSGIRVGDVVVLKSPDDNGPDLVKRVVAVEGDTVEFRRQHFYVAGVERPAPGQTESFHPTAHDRKLTLEPGQYYVLGDNRPKSHDSEEFGPVDRTKIKKIVFWRYWPLSRMGRITPQEKGRAE
ncbi:signal peptidase I [Candidatus Sumerlaeota bacterium]|nr:signal peptidase I [Candidatus Sumerlaeota bacterium]